ncbi:hypothetical protein ACJMK2_015360 [Sinanodonta woodiana]|uniref:Vacuolar fusion protein MON1 homolog n=1 Tax=Sinanodonta woodiana TaxID=1069815 RepID=A0ABD3UQ31_SINWO
MAETGEAEQSQLLDPDREELIENNAPGDSKNSMLIASDSFENIDIDCVEEFEIRKHKGGLIHEIVKQTSKEEQDEVAKENDDQISAKSDLSIGEDSSEDQGEVFETKDIAEALDESVNPGNGPIVPHITDEDVNSPEWRSQRKHIFIFSDSGKPVYSRYGNEDKLVTIFGVMQALVSFIQVSGDVIRSIIAGEHRFVFLIREHLILVGVSNGTDSTQQMLMQLTYLYNQVLSVLTFTSLQKIYKQRRNYDLRRQLSGAEKFLDSLLNMMETEPGFLLGAVRCLPLESTVRDMIAQSIVQHAKVKDLVFTLIIANSQLVTLVRMKKYYLHPMDLHILINLINAAESFKAAESWTPICLPKFDSSGFLQAHISYLDESCQTCLILLTVDRESFFTLSECKNRIQERLVKYNGLQAIGDSLRKNSYSIQDCKISDLRHFLYKSKSTAQYTSPELEAPYLTQPEQERLFGLYQFLHQRIHSLSRPLKILYHVGPYETLLGWVTQGFELYAVFGPLVTKTLAITAINKLLAWIKREENRLFIMNSVTF